MKLKKNLEITNEKRNYFYLGLAVIVLSISMTIIEYCNQLLTVCHNGIFFLGYKFTIWDISRIMVYLLVEYFFIKKTHLNIVIYSIIVGILVIIFCLCTYPILSQFINMSGLNIGNVTKLVCLVMTCGNYLLLTIGVIIVELLIYLIKIIYIHFMR